MLHKGQFGGEKGVKTGSVWGRFGGAFFTRQIHKSHVIQNLLTKAPRLTTFSQNRPAPAAHTRLPVVSAGSKMCSFATIPRPTTRTDGLFTPAAATALGVPSIPRPNP